MRRIDRHIRSAVLMSMLIVATLVLVVDIVFSLADELADTGNNYTSINALRYVLFTAPTNVYELLPFIALIGALIGLGVLASHNELVVIQAAGVKVWRIVVAVLKPTLAVMLLGLVLGEFVSPPLEQVARSDKAIQQSGSSTINPEQGTWRRVGNEFIHINAIAPGGTTLFGVTRYRFDNNRRLQSASFAETATYADQGGSSYWRLNDIRVSRFSADRVTTESYLQEDWQVELSPELLSVLLVEPDQQSITGLYRLANFFSREGLDSGAYFLAFWKKLLQPLATLALVVLGVSFIFGPLRESTTGSRVFVAIGIGLGFSIMQRMLEPASLLYGFNPLIAVLTPILICAGFGWYLMGRVR